jgi:hypothetical protein
MSAARGAGLNTPGGATVGGGAGFDTVVASGGTDTDAQAFEGELRTSAGGIAPAADVVTDGESGGSLLVCGGGQVFDGEQVFDGGQVFDSGQAFDGSQVFGSGELISTQVLSVSDAGPHTSASEILSGGIELGATELDDTALGATALGATVNGDTIDASSGLAAHDAVVGGGDLTVS